MPIVNGNYVQNLWSYKHGCRAAFEGKDYSEGDKIFKEGEEQLKSDWQNGFNDTVNVLIAEEAEEEN
jgi:hypothetical protein